MAMSELTQTDWTEFLKEREAMLLAGDLDRLMQFHVKWNPGSAPYSSREIAEVALHKARTGVKSLPMSMRKSSKQWLIERGYHSFDDGDIQ